MKINKENFFAGVFLFIAFSASFYVYLFKRSSIFHAISTVALVLSVIISCVQRPGRATQWASRVFSRGFVSLMSVFLLGAIFAVIFSVPLKLSGGSLQCFAYLGLLLVAVTSARFLLFIWDFKDILDIYCLAFLFCLAGLVAFGGSEVFALAAETRELNEGFHPNLLAFIMVGFGAVGLAQAVYGGFLRYVAGLGISAVGLYVAYRASSRGSFFALVGAYLLFWGLYVWRQRRTSAYLLTLLGGAFACVVFLVAQGAGLWDRLELTSKHRGLDSGLSGRLEVWYYLKDYVDPSYFITGVGFRVSESLAGSIDNGPLVILLDNGFIAALAILGFWLMSGVGAVKAVARREPDGAAWLIVAFVFIANNMVARYMLGIGNSFSLLGLMLMASIGKFDLPRFLPPFAQPRR